MQEHLSCKVGAYTITHESKTNWQLKQLISEAAKMNVHRICKKVPFSHTKFDPFFDL